MVLVKVSSAPALSVLAGVFCARHGVGIPGFSDGPL